MVSAASEPLPSQYEPTADWLEPLDEHGTVRHHLPSGASTVYSTSLNLLVTSSLGPKFRIIPNICQDAITCNSPIWNRSYEVLELQSNQGPYTVNCDREGLKLLINRIINETGGAYTIPGPTNQSKEIQNPLASLYRKWEGTLHERLVDALGKQGASTFSGQVQRVSQMDLLPFLALSANDQEASDSSRDYQMYRGHYPCPDWTEPWGVGLIKLGYHSGLSVFISPECALTVTSGENSVFCVTPALETNNQNPVYGDRMETGLVRTMNLHGKYESWDTAEQEHATLRTILSGIANQAQQSQADAALLMDFEPNQPEHVPTTYRNWSYDVSKSLRDTLPENWKVEEAIPTTEAHSSTNGTAHPCDSP